MIIFAETEEVWTFNDVNKMSNQFAHFLIDKGYKRRDTMAIFMQNQPKYMVALLGLAKIGVTAALINNNLTQEVRYKAFSVLLFTTFYVTIHMCPTMISITKKLGSYQAWIVFAILHSKYYLNRVFTIYLVRVYKYFFR